MGAHDANLVERDVPRTDEAVPDREDGLPGDRERRLVQEVVSLVDGARERALDRKDAEGDLAFRRRLDHGREARQRNEIRALGEQAVAGGGRMRAVAARIGDVHSHG
jgi:hypothetical protein